MFITGVGVKKLRQQFLEYWSSHYLGYTMSCTSTCPITHFIPKNVVTLVTFSFFVNRNAIYLAYH
jgi:dTDP-4-amino-4,6-dideoxygalactose transaminase